MKQSDTFFLKLKSLRESNEIKLEEIAEYTKINIRYLESIESGKFDILPYVYMRLFLRSYSDFIGADSKESLKDLELFLTGKTEIEDIKITQKNPVKKEAKDNVMILPINEKFQISPKRIIIIVSICIGLFILLSIVSKLSKQQEIRINDKMDTSQISNVNNLKIVKSNLSEKGSIQTQANIAINKIDNNLLNDNNYNQSLYKGYISHIINTDSIAIFKIKTKNKTKVNITNYNSNNIVSYNKILPADTTINFTIDSTLSFDLYSASHIESYINNISLEKYFTKDNIALRGSFDKQTSQLYVSYFKYR